MNEIIDNNTCEKKEHTTISSFDTIVISGASSKCLKFLGALQYLYDNNYLNDIENFTGTSAGAILLYLLAIGYTPVEIMVYICTNQLFEKIAHFNIVAMINGHGASSFSSIYEQLEKMTIEKIGYIPTFSDLKLKLKKNFVCFTFNITSNIEEMLSFETNPNMPCLIAIRMSSNLPLVFENYKYGNNLYVDGGVTNNFPLDYAEKIGKKIIGITFTTSESSKFSSDKDINILEFIYKLMFVPISQKTNMVINNASNKCKIIKLKSIKTTYFNFNFNSVEKLNMFSDGYQETKDVFEKKESI
jgi:NTE family protein